MHYGRHQNDSGMEKTEAGDCVKAATDSRTQCLTWVGVIQYRATGSCIKALELIGSLDTVCTLIQDLSTEYSRLFCVCLHKTAAFLIC